MQALTHRFFAQAIRAIRHPERYGPRASVVYGPPGTPGYIPGQSRARGLTRAILDTFPVVKFGGAADSGPAARAKDVESTGGSQSQRKDSREGGESSEDMELRAMPALAMVTTGDEDAVEGEREAEGDKPHVEKDVAEVARTGPATTGPHVQLLVPGPRPQRTAPRPDTTSALSSDLVPDAIGRETCPICIVDFEEGDDLRVLPCEGHHRFHQACVDPWLLELSSSCPICRQGMSLVSFFSVSDAESLRRFPCTRDDDGTRHRTP